MVERQIVIEPLQKRFKVGLKSANKQARNRSFANATNCCGKRVVQEKHCAECDNVVDTKELQRKIVKIGKQDHLIDGQALKDIQEQLAMNEDIVLHTFLKEEPREAIDRYAGLEYGVPAEKRDAEYAELVAILKGRVAVGTGVFGRNEFQILLTAEDGIIRIRKLIEESQRYEFDERACDVDVQVNREVVAMENRILNKQTLNGFDVKQFKDTRADMEEHVIEEFVLNGKVPEVKAEVQQKHDTNELERLKALMGE